MIGVAFRVGGRQDAWYPHPRFAGCERLVPGAVGGGGVSGPFLPRGDRTWAEESVGEELAEDCECAEGADEGFVFRGVMVDAPTVPMTQIVLAKVLLGLVAVHWVWTLRSRPRKRSPLKNLPGAAFSH